MKEKELKKKIVSSLIDQGFFVNGHVAPATETKDHYREIQNLARKEQIAAYQQFIVSHYQIAKSYFPDPLSIDPSKIKLELRIVNEGSIEHTLYRWWNLVWWSVPFQRAYGRQMRFIIWDVTHDAPFGIIGLQSPVLRMSVRDNHLEIPKADLDYVVNKSMQAQRLGALPPYNQLVGGKLVASILTSLELRKAYEKKYRHVETVIMGRVIEPHLLFITTTSAFGKSSIYNRLKFRDQLIAESLGYTKGSGTFHVTDEIYKLLQDFLRKKGIDVNTTFGFGPSRKMRLIDKAFTLLDMKEYHYHNIQREFFIFPIAKNLSNVISRNVRPIFYQRSIADLTDFWIERWAVKRAERNPKWREFDFNAFVKDFEDNFNIKMS